MLGLHYSLFSPQLTTLLGGIGGILGVYLGFSFLALFELFDVFGRTLFARTGSATAASSRTSSLDHLTDAVIRSSNDHSGKVRRATRKGKK